MTKRAVIYARQSTPLQQSIPAQISALEGYAKDKDIAVAAVFEDIMSGKDTNRDGFTAMKNYITEHPIDVVLVWRLDRLARNLKDLQQFLSDCDKANVIVFSLNEQISKDKHGRSDNIFLVQMLGAIAEYQKSVMKENQQIAYLNKHQQGKIVSSNVSYGYRLDGDELQINNEEAEAVRQIFDLYVGKEMGYKTIAEHLNASGQLNRGNKLWHTSRIKAILDNPFYVGKVQSKYGDANTHNLPLVSVELFEKVSERQSDGTPTIQRVNRRYVLQRKIRCPHCQTVCTPTHTLTRNRDYYYYSCSLYTANGKRHCPGILLNALEVEKNVSTQLTRFIQSDYLWQQVKAQIVQKNLMVEKENNQKELQLKQRQMKLIRDFEKGLIDDDQLSEELVALNNRKEKLKLEPMIPESITNLIDLNLSIANNPTLSQYRLYQSIVDKVEVNADAEVIGLYLNGLDQNILEVELHVS